MNIFFRKKKVLTSTNVTEPRNTNLKVLMFPWLAYGLISPFLNLAKKLADKGFLIRVCSTPISLESIDKEIPEKYSASIKIVDFGVPIIAMPIHLDQPMNARLMVELGVAVEIVRDDDSKVHREEIMQVLESVIVGEIGENLRTKVRDISRNLKSIRGEEMDVAAEELIQLCKNYNKCK